MNPFDLSGPDFLVFYVVFAALTVRVTRWYVERREATAPLPPLTNPEQIAFLRDGENEAMRICALTLLDRGWLLDDRQTITMRDLADIKHLRPLEQAILRKFEKPAPIHAMYADPAIQRACEPIERALRERSLLMNEQVFESRRDALMIGLLLLIVMAAIKIAVAFSRGRTNVAYLIVLTLGFSFYLVYRLRRIGPTGLGKQALADLRRLFKRRRGKAHELRARFSTDEAALLAAVFGLSVLPVSAYPFVPHLQPSASQSSSSDSSSGSSSSCGSSCSGGGGGGCGGCGS